VQLFRILILLFLAAPAAAQDKVALVIGNAAYVNASTLANPRNDARAVAEKLTSIGFEVDLYEDLDGQSFRVALGAFSEKALNAELALVFYAGHGIEMNGQNYLIPIDAKMRSEATAQFEAVPLEQVLSAVREAGKLGMVMLDACRDNPFANTITRKNGTRAVSRGLAPVSVEGEKGLLVSFAAEAGRTADDGDAQHSPYTAALLEVLDKPGLEVGRMFRTVRAKVRETTNDKQVPIEQMQLPDEEIYLVSGPVPDVTNDPAEVTKVSPPPQPQEDPTVVYFAAIKAGTVEALNDFIQAYPTHPKAEEARKIMASMEDDAFWEVTKAAGTVAAYRRYLLVFPDGNYAVEATDWLTEAQLPAVETPPPPPVQTISVSPSFDCSYAKTDAEIAICSSNELAQQDHAMLAAYKRAIAKGVITKSQQREWVEYRDAVCTGSGAQQCVYQVTNERISALGG
jgi:Caspase domain/Lysozyme inhibitor LprI